jgi:hypothetical protein
METAHPVEPAAARRRGQLRRAAPAALAGLLCALHFSSFDPRAQPITSDVRYFLYFAWQTAEGAVPHRDLFDNKTQLATFAGAALHALGVGLGVPPILAIRAGYLALAALGGALQFPLLRRLCGGSAVAGLLGTLGYLSFGFIGFLPSVGNVPKLWMGTLAPAVALLAGRGRWFAAGAAGALAFMDWQIGALAWLGAAAAAARYGAPRGRACLRVCAGGAAGIAPFAVYFAAQGALDDAIGQVVFDSWERGGAAVAGGSLADRVARLSRAVASACPEQQWLFYASFLGFAPLVAWWRRGPAAQGAMALSLLVYHAGLAGFTLVDFQRYGDLLVLLQTNGFLLGALWAGLYVSARTRWPAAGAPRHALAIAALVAAGALARPAGLRPPLAPRHLLTPGDVSLEEQRAVALAVREAVGDGPVALLDHSELLYLGRLRNALPLVFWNHAAWVRFREAPDEPAERAVARLIRAAAPVAFAWPPEVAPDPELSAQYPERRFPSRSELWAPVLRLKTRLPIQPPGPGRVAPAQSERSKR